MYEWWQKYNDNRLHSTPSLLGTPSISNSAWSIVRCPGCLSLGPQNLMCPFSIILNRKFSLKITVWCYVAFSLLKLRVYGFSFIYLFVFFRMGLMSLVWPVHGKHTALCFCVIITCMYDNYLLELRSTAIILIRLTDSILVAAQTFVLYTSNSLA